MFARAEAQAPHSAPVASRVPEKADADRTDGDATDDQGKPRSSYWLTTALGLAAVIAIASAMLIRWRATRSARRLPPNNQDSSALQELSDQHAEAQDGGSRRTRGAPAFTTPAAQQKQMEADGRVQIDWDKDMWNKPEWQRLFGERSAPSEPAPTRLESEANRPASDEPVSGEAPEPADDLSEVDPTDLLESETASLSEEDAARLLASDLTNLTEAELTNLTEADLVALTKADAANLAEAGMATVDDTRTMPDPPRLQRRAGRR